MKIALICPSNILFMPYVNNYESILKTNKVDCEIINWDRFHIESQENQLKYRDSKSGHQRSPLDYYRYSRFIIKILKNKKYDKVIVFGIQLIFFLQDILLDQFKGKYIIDIRDHNKIINFFNIKKVINGSDFTVLSSPGFKKWLPSSDKYITNHNTQTRSNTEFKGRGYGTWTGKVNIACIGAIRDYRINIDFIDAVKNNKRIGLYFHGEGEINDDITRYLKTNGINNVFLSGRYRKEEEEYFYEKSNLINVLRYNDSINNRTALPNRLYNSVLYGIPMIAMRGTYLSEQIEKYNLGLVIDSFFRVENEIINYLEQLNEEALWEGRASFFENVINENIEFERKLIIFTG